MKVGILLTLAAAFRPTRAQDFVLQGNGYCADEHGTGYPNLSFDDNAGSSIATCQTICEATAASLSNDLAGFETGRTCNCRFSSDVNCQHQPARVTNCWNPASPPEGPVARTRPGGGAVCYRAPTDALAAEDEADEDDPGENDNLPHADGEAAEDEAVVPHLRPAHADGEAADTSPDTDDAPLPAEDEADENDPVPAEDEADENDPVEDYVYSPPAEDEADENDPVGDYVYSPDTGDYVYSPDTGDYDFSRTDEEAAEEEAVVSYLRPARADGEATAERL